MIEKVVIILGVITVVLVTVKVTLDIIAYGRRRHDDWKVR